MVQKYDGDTTNYSERGGSNLFISNFRLLQHLCDHPGLSLEEKGLAVCLARYRNSGTLRCTPPIQTIASTMSGNNSGTPTKLRRMLRKLGKKGVLVQMLRPKGARGPTMPAQVWFLFDLDEAESMARNPEWQWISAAEKKQLVQEIVEVRRKINGKCVT